MVRFTRAGVLDVISRNYVLYQRAMGLPRALIVWKYMLRNALTSTVTQIGLIFGMLLANAVVDRDGVRLAGHRHLCGELDPAVGLQRDDGLHDLGRARS